MSKTKSWAYYFCSVQQLFSLLLKSFDYSADRSFDLRAQPRSRPPVLNKIKINSWNYKFSKKLVKTCEGNWFISLPTKLIQLRWRRKAVKILSQKSKSNQVGECFRRYSLADGSFWNCIKFDCLLFSNWKQKWLLKRLFHQQSICENFKRFRAISETYAAIKPKKQRRRKVCKKSRASLLSSPQCRNLSLISKM